MSSCLEARPYKIDDRSGPAYKLFKGRMHQVGSAEWLVKRKARYVDANTALRKCINGGVGVLHRYFDLVKNIRGTFKR